MADFVLIGNGGLNIHDKFWACSYVMKRVSESTGIVFELVVFTSLSLLLITVLRLGVLQVLRWCC